jgi:hypothetical protein
MSCARGCCPTQAEHYRSVQLDLGDLSPEVADTNRREKELALDRDAYKRLRNDGLQPNDVTGSAHLEKHVQDQIEIDFKIPIPAKDLERVKEIQFATAAENYGKKLAK